MDTIYRELSALETLSATLSEIEVEMTEERMPRIIMEKVLHGHHVTIVEPVMPLREGGVKRGYLWTAVIEPEALTAGYISYDGMIVPGQSVGGEKIAHSTKSAAAAVENARRILRKRPATEHFPSTPRPQPADKPRKTARVKRAVAPVPVPAPVWRQYDKVRCTTSGVQGIILEMSHDGSRVAVSFGARMEWVSANSLTAR